MIPVIDTDRAVADFAWQLQPLTASDEPFDVAAQLLQQLLPSVGITHGHLDIDRGVVVQQDWPAQAFVLEDMGERLLATWADHPHITCYLPIDGRVHREPRRTSDIITPRDLRKTRAYAEVIRPGGWQNQLTILTRSRGAHSGVEWIFNRGRTDFTDDELSLAERLQSVLVIFEWTQEFPVEQVGDTDAPLSAREAQVIRCLAQGFTAHAVGSILGISEGTVRKHTENAYRKLGANTKVVAIARARVLGII